MRAGGLISYGPNYANLRRQAADMVDKILRGTKQGDIPVEHPSKFEPVINLVTARALGVTVPELLLANANKVISSLLAVALRESAYGTKRTLSPS